MCADYVALKRLHWGIWSQGTATQILRIVGCLAVVGACAVASAEPLAHASDAALAIEPDPPPRAQPITVPPAAFRPSWDLDGFYVWLGPLGAASHIDARWDSTFGAALTATRVREHAALGVVGVDLGASRWTRRDGGRIWLDALVGTRVFGRMMGVSLGPLVELSELARPRFGASIGVWGHAGIAPFVRFGAISNTGMFAELGVHLALPVSRR